MLASAFLFHPSPASAGTQSLIVPIVVALDNPHINSSVSSPDVVSLGITMPGTNTTIATPLDDASAMLGPNGYTW